VGSLAHARSAKTGAVCSGLFFVFFLACGPVYTYRDEDGWIDRGGVSRELIERAKWTKPIAPIVVGVCIIPVWGEESGQWLVKWGFSPITLTGPCFAPSDTPATLHWRAADGIEESVPIYFSFVLSTPTDGGSEFSGEALDVVRVVP
jgi:hypothetical protein